MTFDKVIIETSPYMRCIQSAAALADGLNIPEIEINFMIGEHLYARDYAEFSPVPTLNSVTTPLDDAELRKTYNLPDSVKINNNWHWYDEYRGRYLEELSDCHKRAMIIK